MKREDEARTSWKEPGRLCLADGTPAFVTIHPSDLLRIRGRADKEREYRSFVAGPCAGAVFTLNDPKRIAASLKRSAESSKRGKSSPYRSALSMLTFLPASQRRTLQRAKVELRKQFKRA